MLFTGDVAEMSMRALIEQGADLQADVLIAPHHGSFERSTPAFIEAVRPGVILASNARRLSGKQRDFDRAVAGIPLYRTHQHGAITVTIDASGSVKVEPLLRRRH